MLTNDLIGRQTAIEKWKNDFKGYVNALNIPKDDYNGIMEYIDELPSAQPDLDEWCYDCKEYDQERHCCPRWNRVIRQTLIDAQNDNISAYYRSQADASMMFIEAMKELGKNNNISAYCRSQAERRTDECTN